MTHLPLNTSTHLLHLAPHGEILPHVDNLDASGSVIIGVSLGAERTLRLRAKAGKEDESEGWEVKLSSGSVYLQRYVTTLQGCEGLTS
jgi:alkylated DNA repair protein alkB family protein 7